MEITGHSAIVTGAGSGLGEATARFLAKAGAKVGLLDLDKEQAARVADEIGGLAFGCDVTNAEAVEQALEEAREHHGRLRICVNCAGFGGGRRIVGRDGPMPLDLFRHEIEGNLIGTFNVMRLAAAQMAQTDPVNQTGERGVIVNTASAAATEGQIGQAPYSAAKAGIMGLTLQAAREFTRIGVRVMTISPGLFMTPSWDIVPSEVIDSLIEKTEFPKRMGEPHEFAMLVGHIVENPMLNGEVIRLDGALRMQAT